MKNDWILDVLADLKNFAVANGMPAVADKLNETAELAMIEIASDERKARTRNGNECTLGSHLREVGNGRWS